MNNLDTPVMALNEETSDRYMEGVHILTGFTKREQACLTMGVADTGDAELDAIITKGNFQKLAGLAMQAMLSASSGNFPRQTSLNTIAEESIIAAKVLLQQLKGDV
tara:strand:+ start:1447 stop:1764 length:318 start_codon:yes stop_codon:yes gene_type:complete